MNRFLFLLLLSLLSSCKESIELKSIDFQYCDSANISLKTKYNIVLIIGQSNTHYGVGLDLSIDIPQQGVMQLGRFGGNNYQVITANEPLEHHTAREEKIGFALTFANLFKEQLLDEDDTVILIPCGSGGTSFMANDWNKGDHLYIDAVERVKYVLNKFPNSELQAILWHQGESDVENTSYQTALETFINDLRSDLDYPNVPFILGGMVPHWVRQEEERINQQGIIAAVKDRLSHIGYASPHVPFTIKKIDDTSDEIHFDAAGQRELGWRYFNEFICLKNE